MYRMGIIIVVLVALGVIQAAMTVPSSSADKQNADGSRGVTVDDLGRGVKSAAQNIEREIPKMGSAIGNAFKKITDQGSGKSPSQEGAKRK